ncbi:hypothetical protein OAZ93_02540 [Prochlorococcus sp. AH-736-F09]|nr:hypothetical protein [Prochlorococcus sp. AH-736-F09]
MRKFLLSLLLFSSPVFAEEYTIYTRERPPHQISGIIDADRNFYSFTNRRVKCDLVALGCYLKTNVKAELISKDIIKVGSSYYCSEDHIKASNKDNPKPVLTRGGGYIDYGYGKCTKDGWQRKSMQ